MAKSRRKRIKGDNIRFLISDVLPYEVPPFFSNQQIVSFLHKFGLYSKEGLYKEIDASNSIKDPFALDCLRILLSEEKNITSNCKNKSIAYSYIINAGKGKKRTVSVIHPMSQCLMTEYISKYAPLIIKHCSKSFFSLRKPVRVATKKYYKDFSHNFDLNKRDGFERENKEYEVLKSYFVYNKNSNLYKFFDSVTFLEAEKKFSKVRCLDIQKCFDSIYTHSIDWAVVGKKNSKDNLGHIYTSRFDTLMQGMNYNETNGIVIGPEFSRVFAEMILSSVDYSLQTTLSNEDNKLEYGKDYLIFRYVDDYFIFFNEEKVIDIIQVELALALKEYKLFFNEDKIKEYSRPIITPTSIAKAHICDLIESRFPSIRIEKEDDNKTRLRLCNTKASAFIQSYKSIIAECNVSIKDVIGYSLMLIEESISKSLSEIRKVIKVNEDVFKSWKKNFDYLFSLYFEILFFLIHTSDSTTAVMNSVRMLDSIVSEYISITNPNGIPPYLADYVYSQIVSYLKKYSNERRMECIYLISLASSIIRQSYLPEELLSVFVERYDYFSLVTILRYCFFSGQTDLYKELVDKVFDLSTARIKGEREYISNKHAEVSYLVLDLLCCPLLGIDRKKSLLNDYCSIFLNSTTGKKNDLYYEKLIEFIIDNKVCPTKWDDYSLSYELVQKKGLSVY